MRSYIITYFIALALASCTTVKLAVPDQFSSQATKLAVKGLQGWQVNQQLSFGPFHTSKIKRGWDMKSSLQHNKFNIKPEEMLLRVFTIETDKLNQNASNKFQYTLQDGNLMAEVFATEKFTEKQLVYKSNNPYIGSASKTSKYEYAFTAAILPLAATNNDPWSFVLINRYDVAKDTASKLYHRPYVEEEGYATNGKESIAIRPLRIEKMTSKKGKDTKLLGGKILSGYELQWDGGIVAIIDILDNNIWLANNLEPADKLILSSISSAILLKRMQDIEKDKDALHN